MAFVGAFLAAFLLSIVLRRVALATGLVDRPGPGKRRAHEVPYLGGVAIAVAALCVWPFNSDFPVNVTVVGLAALAILVVGLLDDAFTLGPLLRIAAEVLAAGVVVMAGVRAEPFGNPVLDIAITIVWIVGVTNALNLLDNMDGLAAGVAGAAAFGVFTLAAILGQDWIATASLALAGACAGFLVHNWRPASIYMGDAGSLFLGFVLSIAVLGLRPEVTPPRSLLVPVLLLALPVLDTTVVTFARVRHGRSILSGGTDHISHRLVGLGLSTGVAVATLVGVEVVMAAIAVAYGAAAMPFWAAVLAGGVTMVALAVVASQADVYEEPVVGLLPGLRQTLAPEVGLVPASFVSQVAEARVVAEQPARQMPTT
jgi:UDP-GlcNAc:undecaprenyl-phosphate GlcNAc-1-phosphate transferase